METLNFLGDAITSKLHNGKNLFDLKYLLEQYNGNDWKNYLSFSEEKYTRNKVYTNGDIDILVICWNNNQQSGIHDHPENGCLLRMLQGSIKEEVYIKQDDKYTYSKTNYLEHNKVSYKEGNCCIHNIMNGNQLSVSLHIYSPSNYKTIYYER